MKIRKGLLKPEAFAGGLLILGDGGAAGDCMAFLEAGLLASSRAGLPAWESMVGELTTGVCGCCG